MKTEAWLLERGEKGDSKPGTLVKGDFELPEMTDHDVLGEPIFGAWEANMTHALERSPVDVCRIRREPFVVLGNAGVIRILKTGRLVTTCKVGDICGLVPIGSQDGHGHMVQVLGYDMPGTMGVLAKQWVGHELNVAPVPNPTRHSYERWAGFSVRYCTAWDNWKLCHEIWKAQFDGLDVPAPHVSGWGGGVALATVQLAKHFGAHTSLITSTDQRIALLKQYGITPIDRRSFPDLDHDPQRYENDRVYRAKYLASEKVFLDLMDKATNGEGVSIFMENIGSPVFRATLRALGRLGMVTTSGWKMGKQLEFSRPAECVGRHVLVHTHGCRRNQGIAAGDFAEEHDWLPPEPSEVYDWEDIPQLAATYAAGQLDSYAPVFRVNPL